MCEKLNFEFQKHGVKVSALKLGFEKKIETWIQNMQKFKTWCHLGINFQL
jgi:flagellar biosynthesis chaperone FliJ